MKVRNWRRKLATSLIAAGLFFPGMTSAAPLNTNLVVNGDFESVDYGNTGAYNAPDILDWGGAVVGGAYSHTGYSGTGDFANGGSYTGGSPLAGGGDFYFTPGNRGNDSLANALTQSIDVSTGDSATLIATGNAAYSLSAFFSSFASQGDFGTVQAEFFDGSNASLGTASISDLDTTTWSQTATAGLIPIGTSSVTISSYGTALGGSPDGYTDNIDFQVTDQVILPTLDITIDRATGAITLNNQTTAAVNISGYVIGSNFGALNPDQWLSVADNYDADSGGSVDASNNWSELTQAGANGDLSEADLTSGTGTSLAAGASINLGNAGTWIRNPNEDLTFEFVSGGSAVTGLVRFEGNNAVAFELGDLDFDGNIDSDDWAIFRAGQQADMQGLSQAEAYQLGDLTGDLANNHPDFVAFKNAYEAANGPGSFASLVGSVPEPSSWILLVGACFSLLGFTRTKRTNK